MGLLYWIVVGLIAGWLAGKVTRGGGYGVVIDIVLGILGGIVGGWVFGMLGIWPGGGILGSIIVAFVGAVTGVDHATGEKCLTQDHKKLKRVPQAKRSLGGKSPLSSRENASEMCRSLGARPETTRRLLLAGIAGACELIAPHRAFPVFPE